ncbi:MAG: hypothetical protein WC718_10135 [Phycisphaerales bacterium]|jgi:hypothetical protein
MSVMERSISRLRQPPAPVAKVVWRVGTAARPQLTLVVTVSADGQGIAEVSDARGSRELCEFFSAIRVDAGAGLMHIDAPHFAATLRLGGEPLYAKTDLLAQLGVRGGRYEIAKA